MRPDAGIDAGDPSAGERGFGGIPSRRTIGSLSAVEATAFCRDALAYSHEQVPPSEQHRFLCTVQALYFTETADACTTEVAECLVEEAPAEECSFSDTAREGCELPVGVYEQCHRDKVANLVALAPQLRCELAGEPSALEEVLAGAALPPSCHAALTACPALFRGSDE